MNAPVILGVEIPCDTSDRFNLAALHLAAIKSGILPNNDANKKPAQFIRTKHAKETISAIQSVKGIAQPLNMVSGGINPGTYAHESLAIDYAAWISPMFRLQVYDGFLAYKEGNMSIAIGSPQETGLSNEIIYQDMNKHLTRLEEVINRKLDEVKIRSEIEMKPCARYMSEASPATIFDDMRYMAELILDDETSSETILAAQMLEQVTGYNPYTLAGRKIPTDSPMNRTYVTPTEIGVYMGGYSGKGINNALVKLGYQTTKIIDNRNHYAPTEKGKPYWHTKTADKFTTRARWCHDIIPALLTIFTELKGRREKKGAKDES